MAVDLHPRAGGLPPGAARGVRPPGGGTGARGPAPVVAATAPGPRARPVGARPCGDHHVSTGREGRRDKGGRGAGE